MGVGRPGINSPNKEKIRKYGKSNEKMSKGISTANKQTKTTFGKEEPTGKTQEKVGGIILENPTSQLLNIQAIVPAKARIEGGDGGGNATNIEIQGENAAEGYV